MEAAGTGRSGTHFEQKQKSPGAAMQGVTGAAADSAAPAAAPDTATDPDRGGGTRGSGIRGDGILDGGIAAGGMKGGGMPGGQPGGGGMRGSAAPAPEDTATASDTGTRQYHYTHNSQPHTHVLICMRCVCAAYASRATHKALTRRGHTCIHRAHARPRGYCITCPDCIHHSATDAGPCRHASC